MIQWTSQPERTRERTGRQRRFGRHCYPNEANAALIRTKSLLFPDGLQSSLNAAHIALVSGQLCLPPHADVFCVQPTIKPGHCVHSNILVVPDVCLSMAGAYKQILVLRASAYKSHTDGVWKGLTVDLVTGQCLGQRLKTGQRKIEHTHTPSDGQGWRPPHGAAGLMLWPVVASLIPQR